MKTVIVALTFMASPCHAKVPIWAANNSTKINGSTLYTVCHGLGPSVDIARSEALKSCQLSAGQFFKSKIKIKSLSVETEKSVGFHQEVSSEDELTDLICDPTRDQLEEVESQYSFWLECKFNLNPVKIKSFGKTTSSIAEEDSGLAYFEPPKRPENKPSKTVFITTVPKCDSVIIRGARPRTVECKNNPIELDITADDDEAIIRVPKYKPKTIQLRKRTDNETIQILFEK